ncbi:MAG: VCBS repeat-containing protein [Gammaproteobacteria bacterium]|nr:VCBS repeat-containing protein [Gammaproteobacteria bacterium]
MLHIFLQDESGRLAAPIKYATVAEYQHRPETIAIGDINNDGLADVVIGHGGKAIEIFRQNVAGGFDAPTSILSIYSNQIRIGDLNDDGLADIAGIGRNTDAVGLYLQDANGDLQGPQTYYAPYGSNSDLDLGDVNDDGLTDIVIMAGNGYSYNDLAVLTQNNVGGFNPATYYDPGENNSNKSVTIGDVNGDGLNDVSISYGGNRPRSRIGIYYQDSNGLLSDPVSLPSHDIPNSLVARDVNNDNLVDLVVVHGGWVKMGVYLQLLDGQMAA